MRFFAYLRSLFRREEKSEVSRVLKYTDFEGNEHEVEASIVIETHGAIINDKLAWEERKVIFRVEGNIVGRRGLAYREVERTA